MDKKAPKAKEFEPWQIEDAGRLKALFENPDKNELSQLKFGAEFGLGSPGMVWQYLTCYRPLNIKAAVAFAKGLRCKVEDFSPTIASEIADAMIHARAVPAVDDLGETELHRLSKAEIHLITRFRLTDDDGRADLLDTADTVPVNASQVRQPISIVRAARKGGD